MERPGDIINKITMHKLVQVVLAAILLVACVVGAVGLIPYGPPAIIATTIVIAGACVGSNALLSRLYGVRSDSQSALITAGIMALVITPTLSPVALLTAVLIAVISQASKYVIAIRGRHVFNPVAIALVLGSIGGLFYPSWWVAAPPLVAVTLVGALLILYKTRLLGIGLVFIAVSALIVVGRMVGQGSGLPGAVASTITSWPILFFAGFMLTEPTTLPPRRWQKYVVASLVALLFAVPFAIGPIESSPALALIIGNAVAFAFGQRQAIILTFVRSVALTPTIREFVFAPTRPLAFLPGQYVDLFVPHAKADFKSSRRSFSLTSVPGCDDVSLGVRIPAARSTFKTALLDLKPGDTVTSAHVSGDFVLPRDTSEKLVFIAGGIGVTPFISQLRAMRKDGQERNIIILYFVRDKDDIAYESDIEQADGHIFSDGETVSLALLAKYVPDIRDRAAYISGPPGMVNGGKRIAKQAGARRIRTDYFSGY